MSTNLDAAKDNLAATGTDAQSASNSTQKSTPKIQVEIIDSAAEETTNAKPEIVVAEVVTAELADDEIASLIDSLPDSLSSKSDAVEVVKEVTSSDSKPAVVESKPTADAKKEADSDDADPVDKKDESAFAKLGLRPDVFNAIKAFGYETPTPIQSATVKFVLDGRDVIGQAETGSGKTAAFAWPLLSQIDLQKKRPQILVLAPTRELAIQVTAAFEKYGREMKGLNCVTLYGGTNYETQFRALDRGVHVVVGTPGRLMDHIKRKTLKLNHIKTLVLDEADEMLRMGFIDDVEWVLKQVPDQRQILTFSATMPDPIRRISEKYLRNPEQITIQGDSRAADSIAQSFQIVAQRQKIDALARILDTEPTDGVIVFTKTKMTAIVVAEQLERRGYPTAALHGDIAQKHRERSVNQLKSGRVSVLVATDVAARGLDVPRISHVVNYDFPHDTETYIHRIGRTGRAGREGSAILFVEPKERRKLNRLEHEAKQRIKQFEPCSITDVNKRRVEEFKSKLFGSMKNRQMSVFQKLFAEMIEEQPEYTMDQIAAACAVMAQGTTPLYLDAMPTKKRNKKDRGERVDSRDDSSKTTYRIEVGRNHGVGPGNIVGAIANEAGLDSADIGRIKLMDDFSLIDLPSDMDGGTLEILYNVSVGSSKLKTRKDEGGNHASRSPRIKRNNGSTDFVKKRKRKANAAAEGEDKPWKKKEYNSDRPWKKKNSAGDKPWKKKSSGGSSKPWEKKSTSGSSKPWEKKSAPSTGEASKASGKSGSKPAAKGSKYIKVRSKTKKGK